METEKKNEAPEESSFCNCENVEQITPYEADDCDYHYKKSTSLSGKRTQFCNAFRSSVARISQALKSGGYNPYVQHTNVCRIEIFKKKGDAIPVDRFEINAEKGTTVRVLLIVTAIALGAICLTECKKNRNKYKN